VDNQGHQGDRRKFGVPVHRTVRLVASAPAVLSVVLADDTPDLLALMRLTFDDHGGLEVLAEAVDGQAALELWRTHRPDVVVLDVRMPVMTGLEAARRMLAEDPAQVVVLFAAVFDPADYDVADAIGVAGCFDKRDLDRLPELVHALARRVRQL
jgi:CheY-like chemotaxis protein